MTPAISGANPMLNAQQIINELYQKAVQNGGARMTLSNGVVIGIGIVRVRGGRKSAKSHGRIQYNVGGKTRGRAAMVKAIEDAASSDEKHCRVELYHGTPNELFNGPFDRNAGVAAKRGVDTFDTIGIWFVDQEADARKFAGSKGHVIPAKIQVKNALVLQGFKELDDLAKKNGLMRPPKKDTHPQISGKKLRDWLLNEGYDAIHIKGGGAGDFKGSTSDYWVALYPEKIIRLDEAPDRDTECMSNHG